MEVINIKLHIRIQRANCTFHSPSTLLHSRQYHSAITECIHHSLALDKLPRRKEFYDALPSRTDDEMKLPSQKIKYLKLR